MSYIGIGSPIPDIASLPGQTGGEVEVNLNYPSAAVCSNGSDQTPSVKSPNGGTFSSTPSGLSINSSSGVVDVSESTPNNYTISYTVEGVVSSFAFTINQQEQSTFSYSASSFQQIGTATPTLASGTTAGGSFTASTGVSIVESTGVINLAASTVGGPYTITYTTPGTCSTSSTFQISITAAVRIIANNFALNFNGTDQYVSAGNSTELQFSGSFSISCWVKIDNSGSNAIISKDSNSSVGNGYHIDFRGGGEVHAWAYNAGSKLEKTGLSINNWYNIVFVFESTGGSNGNQSLYINGGTPLTNSITNFAASTVKNLRIGNSEVLSSFGLGGDIDEVAMWNKAISANAVQEIYNATINNPGFTADLFKLANESQAPVYWNRMGDD